MENWTIENFMIVGQAMAKMSTFFWPIILAGCAMMYIEWRKECMNETR
jgi:hypothetical protein